MRHEGINLDDNDNDNDNDTDKYKYKGKGKDNDACLKHKTIPEWMNMQLHQPYDIILRKTMGFWPPKSKLVLQYQVVLLFKCVWGLKFTVSESVKGKCQTDRQTAIAFWLSIWCNINFVRFRHRRHLVKTDHWAFFPKNPVKNGFSCLYVFQQNFLLNIRSPAD